MSVTRTKEGIAIPDRLRQLVIAIKNRGGKIYMCIPDGAPVGSCGNCNGYGKLPVQVVTGGPFTQPGGKGAIYQDGKDYQSRAHVFDCPLCEGTGNVAAPGRMVQQDTRRHVDAVSKKWQQ